MGSVDCSGLVLRAHGQVPQVEAIEVGEPGAGEVRVQMHAAGVCHTDVAAIRDARFVPMLLGHEGAGVVEAIGPGSDPRLIGTRVLLCWKPPCGRCRWCADGAPDRCEHVLETPMDRVTCEGKPLGRLLGTGCFADYVVVPSAAVVPVPTDLPLEHAALVGCAIATGVGAVLRTARVAPGDGVIIWDCGGIGLNVISGARLAHAGSIVAADPDPSRRALALARGATCAVEPANAVACALELSDGRGMEHAFETVGSPPVMAEALGALCVGGQLIIVGAAARDAQLTFRPRRFMSRQQRIVGCIFGSIHPARDLALMLGWLADRTLTVDDLVGTRLRLDELPGHLETRGCCSVRPLVRF